MMMEEEEVVVVELVLGLACACRSLSSKVSGSTACMGPGFIDLLVPVLDTTCHSMFVTRDPFASHNI